MEKLKDRKIAELAHNLNRFDIEEILDVAIKLIPEIVSAHRVSIYLLEEGDQYFVSKRHSAKVREKITEKIAVDSRKSLIPQILLKQKPILITNVQEYVTRNKLEITLSKRQRYTSGSCMLVPLKIRLSNDHEKILGVLNFSEKSDFTPFTKHDLYPATHVADILATAMHNSQVAEKKLGGRQKELMAELSEIKDAYQLKDIKLDEAKRRQKQMLPELPFLQEYSIDVRYSPMEKIGGDFYDFIPIKEDEIGIVVGDVSGHGIEAALVMSMAKQILRIYSKLHGSLVDTLIHTNEEICSNLKGETFVAVFLGVLNTTTHVLRYARAGQTYPMIYNPGRQPEISELKSDGMVLGAVRGDLFRSKMQEKCIQLTANDTLLLYTDGVTEAFDSEGNEFSLAGLIEAMKSTSNGDAHQVTQNILEQIENFVRGPQTDDVTIICLKAGEIKPRGFFNTKKIQQEKMHEADSFIVTPEFTYDEEVHYQMLELEEKISQLESQLQQVEHEKLNLEDRHQEIAIQLDLSISDPDSLVFMLRQQLQVALELPKDLIHENQRLHQEIEKQKSELRNSELELNDWMQNIQALQGKYDELKAKEQQMNKRQQILQDCSQQIRSAFNDNDVRFENKIRDLVQTGNYNKALQRMENLLNLAFDRMDMPTLLALKKQLFKICTVLVDNFQTALFDSGNATDT